MLEALQLAHLLRQAVAEGAAPGMAFGLQVGDRRERHFEGRHAPERTSRLVDAESVYDLASLTKPLTTVLWALRLVSAGRLDLDEPLGLRLPLTDPELRAVPVWRLLNHTSGLPAHRPYFSGLGASVLASGNFAGAEATVRRMLARTVLESPPGGHERYSDLGFLLLAWLCEVAEAPLAEVWPTLPFHGAEALHFRPLSAPHLPGTPDRTLCVPTEHCPWRGRRLQGEVHDDNTWVLGGIAGHAGLFGTLDATLDAAVAWCRGVRGEDTLPGIAPDLAKRVPAGRWMHSQGTRVLGWDTPTPGASSAGQRFGRRAFGHLGFTGTSVWIDPDADVSMVLLMNRVCPSRTNERHRSVRPRLHDLAWAIIDALRTA